jgi:hypothetical protein
VSNRQSRLTELAALAEIVAAVALILSLVYVGREVRQNTAATEGATYQEMVRASNEYLLTVATDSSLAAIVSRGGSDPASLNGEEGLRYFYIRRVFWRNMENAFVQHERGVLADPEWATYHYLLCSQADDVTWTYHAPAFSPAFGDVVEACGAD